MTTATHQPGPALDPALEVLRRPDGSVQLGWGPDTAAVLSPGKDLDAFGLSTVLNLLDGRSSRAEILVRAARAGLADDAVTVLLDELTTVGAVRDPGGTVPVAPRVRVHGRGPLADTLVAHLTVSGTRLSRSAAYTGDSDVARWDVRCVLLADALVPDPRLVRELMRHRVPHLPVLLRDGRGIVGPFVVPGRTSCLRCADLTRTDLDPHWPQLAAQLCDRVGCAEPSAVLATAALALGELDAILTTAAPATLDRTLEVDLRSHRLASRRWYRHPECGCAAPPA
ncbi:TOMM precursor leader peptide-binding protein [Rhodococcus indonesiensis]|uniref:TOMM precursor leader peptide-binding protein n=1 Tax=Rhodococcus indonesiensis TaxID=3055869 RepID=UPI0039F64A40